MPVSRDQEIYGELASILFSATPAKACYIEVNAEVGDDYIRPRFDWFDEIGNRQWFLPENHRTEVENLIWELREEIKNINAGQKWRRFRFKVDRAGKFSIDFTYNNP